MRTIKRIRERRRRELLRFLAYPQRITLGAEPVSLTPLDALLGGVWALPDDQVEVQAFGYSGPVAQYSPHSGRWDWGRPEPDYREQEPPGPDITEWALRPHYPDRYGLGGL